MKVRHCDSELSAENGEYRTPSFSGSLVIEYADRDKDEIPLADEAPLVFKLRNQWQGDGRRVTGISRGYFIVIAPHTWIRSGRAPVIPEGCSDANYSAHYFSIDREDGTDDVGGFDEHKFSLSRSWYALEGRRVHDDSEEGDLFVGAAPVLKPAGGVVWVRMGEEAHNGWDGQNFRPEDESLSPNPPIGKGL